MMSITANRIKSRREQLNMSQETLSTLLGFKSKSAISKIENPDKNIYKNDRDITVSQLRQFAKVLNTSTFYLLGWSNDPDKTDEEYSSIVSQSAYDTLHIIAADTITTEDSPIILHTDNENNTPDPAQLRRNALADKIRNSDYTEEQIDKIEQMINLII